MSSKQSLSRRQFLRLAVAGCGVTAISACASSTPAVVPTTAPAPTAAPVAPTLAPTTAPAAAATAAPAAPAFTLGVTPGSPTNPRGWTTQLPPPPEGMPLNPPVTVTSSRNAINVKFAEGDTFDNSPFTRLIREQLGIEWKTQFSFGTPEERDQKYTLAIASGDLPDFMEAVPLTSFVTMLEAGLVEDITEVFERVASERVKQNLAWNNNYPWIYAQVDGRKMGLPFVEKIAQNDKLLWFRKDWLDKVGMAPPKTLDELGKVAAAFKDGNLGQGAQGTTVGLLASAELNTWYASLDPIFAAYGTVPNYWLKGPDGTLVYGATLPAMKEALARLNEWYQAGLLPSDFDTKQAWEQNSLVAGNQAGLLFGPFFAGVYGAGDSVKNDPTAVWDFVDVPSLSGSEPRRAWSNPIGQFVHCFRKGSPHVEAVLRQVNWMAEWYEVPNAARMHGWEQYNYAWEGERVVSTDAGDSWQFWPYGPIGNSANNGTDVFRGAKNDQFAIDWAKLPREQLDAGQLLVLEDPTGLIPNVRRAYIYTTEVSEEQGIKNEFYGLPTATMKERGADLATLEATQLFGMIKGTVPLSEFDAFVQSWREQGGDQITEEVNAWYAAKPK